MATTKKTTRKKTVKNSSAKTTESQPSTVQRSTVFSRNKLFSKRMLIFLAAVLILGILLYFFRGMFVAATVNGQIIPRWALNQEMERQVGEQTLNDLVTKALILQEMKKQGITVSDEEIQKEIQAIEEELKVQGRALEEALAIEGITREGLVERLQIQKMIEKMFEKDAIVTDEEVDTYLEENADVLPTDTDEQTLRTSVNEQLRQQKLTEKFQAWLAEVQGKASINRFVQF